MKIWQPVYQLEDKYEVNILDGIVRHKTLKDADQEKIIEQVAIETISEKDFEFHGYGVYLTNNDGRVELVAIDKLVVESILKRKINQPIYHKNGIKIDCSYSNLTLSAPLKHDVIKRAEESERFYQYKRKTNKRANEESLVLDKVYDSYKDFNESTGLSYADFTRDSTSEGKIIIGMYVWTFSELKTRGKMLSSKKT